MADLNNPEYTRQTQEFQAFLDPLLQSTGAPLDNLFRMHSDSNAESYTFTRIEQMKMKKRASSFERTELTQARYNTRRVFATRRNAAVGTDDIDNVRAATGDPTHDITQELINAYLRAKTQVCINGLIDPAFIGKEGTETVALPAKNKLGLRGGGETTDSGLTIGKLRKARTFLKKSHAINMMSGEKVAYILCTAEQIEDLLNTTEVTSSDYNSVKALVSGDVDTFLGFKFIEIEDNEMTNDVFIPKTSNNQRDIIAFTSMAGLYYNKRSMRVRISDRPDLNHATQIHIEFDAGCVRIEEGKVMQIACKIS